MRQIRPRTSQPPALPSPVPTATQVPTGMTVDLRDVRQARHPSLTDEQRLRQQLVEVRRSVDEVMDQLSALIDQRENLKARLGSLVASHSSVAQAPAEDRSLVPWGFYDDDL